MGRWRLLIVTLMVIFSSAATTGAAQSRRVVSLGPFITEDLYLLGAQEQLAGVTKYCIRPPQAQEKEIVGTVVEFSTEKVLALMPDVVLATPLSDRRGVDVLRAAGISVVELPQPKDFDQICRQVEQLGMLVGRGAAAAEIVIAAQQRVAAAERMIAGRVRPKVFIQIGSNPLFTTNRDYFIHDLVARAGGDNIAAAADSGIYSREKVIADNPDCIVIATMGLAAEEESRQWRQYPSIAAVKHKRIFVMDSYLVCSPTPVSFAESLEQMIRFLHPEAAEMNTTGAF
ncbi:MAG: helical backbone metal receptor [Candidatus Omnitrophica bacterium]|nr:helical backbone metal receptor [Candidatus Omnitrophota bacterium]